MKITELREVLDRVLSEHGDIEFVLDDPDIGWLFMLDESDLEVIEDELGKRLELTASYQHKIFGEDES